MNSLISSHYVEQNKKLHEDERYGVQSVTRAEYVQSIANDIKAKTILDYGCGKAILHHKLKEMEKGFKQQCQIMNYDPAIPEFEEAPEPADLVVCTDVLEHVEPECLENVLADLRRLTLQALYLVICTRPSSRFLPDGRNAHLIIEPASWWMPKIRRTFTPCRTATPNPYEVQTLLRPR